MREWLVTNGLGGYASLTYGNFNTRKFHGLLVASLNPPTERWVFVSNVYDKVKIKDRVFDLKNLNSEFTFDLFPSFTYHIEKTKLKKTIIMEQGKNTTIIKYDISSDGPLSITHSIISNSRHFYDVTRQRYLSFAQYFSNNCVRVTPSNINKTLRIILDDANYEQTNYWLELFYQKDCERQDSWVDNNVHICDFHKYISRPITYYLILSIEDQPDIDPSSIYAQETKRRQSIIEQAGLPDKFNKLVLSADNFVVKKGNSKSIIAGYHWFSDWGRDTLISLPGLTLVTKRFDDAKNILLTLSGYVKNGLVPNFFAEPDARPVYNTVDASLWFIDRAYQYLKYTGDQNFVENIWTTLASIIDFYKKGTDYGIQMDHDFLISHNPGMTWMDVKIGDYYPTPRAHKAVEIQALWYNALKIMGILSKRLGKDDIYTDVSFQVKDNFLNQYDKRYDVIDKRDVSFRPNQIFLLSLDHSMINKEMQERIVKDIEERLLTVFGLRTLAPEDSRYKGKYIGDFNRDLAYHNGTVWPWLIGPFVKSFVKIHDYQNTWRDYAYQNFLKPMLDVFGKNWDGLINEIFDGDPPYFPRGCISQAWSVAEVLRTWVEDIEAISPKYENLLLTT